jgi:HSP90 family molecular chaperone
MTVENSPQRETHAFQAEINQLLSLVINSLYSHKEIFLRELVSNASDALDKLRFRSMTEPELLAEDADLELRILPDAEKGTLTIEDTGIGMTRDELVKNLGTIAHSGSREFLEGLAQRGQKDMQLIGQFGVGFYSAYLVADHVEVVSRAPGKDLPAWKWASDAKGSFTVEPAERATRGTAITLHLKPDQKEFLEEYRLRTLITQYSDYVGHPIKLQVKKTTGTGDDAKTETALELDEQGQRAVAALQVRNHRRAVPGVLQAPDARLGSAAGVDALPHGRQPAVHRPALRAQAPAVRPECPAAARGAPLRQARLHHGPLRGAGAAVAALRARRHRLG